MAVAIVFSDVFGFGVVFGNCCKKGIWAWKVLAFREIGV